VAFVDCCWERRFARCREADAVRKSAMRAMRQERLAERVGGWIKSWEEWGMERSSVAREMEMEVEQDGPNT
jgi:hypothetical protein